MTASRILHHHGTKLVQLLPQNLVQAAEADLKLKALKAAERAQALAGEITWVDMRPYAFHRRHVARAKDASELLHIACNDIARGHGSGKLQTRVIYSDYALLQAAYRIASS